MCRGVVMWEGSWGCVCHFRELGIRLGVDGLGKVEGKGAMEGGVKQILEREHGDEIQGDVRDCVSIT